MNETLRHNWAAALTAVLALLYLWVGLAAQGSDRALAVAGAILMLAALAVAPRSRPVAMVLLAVGALPLAAATWWSVITPLLMLLALVFGAFAVRDLSHPAAVPVADRHRMVTLQPTHDQPPPTRPASTPEGLRSPVDTPTRALISLALFNAVSAIGGGIGLVTGTLPVPTSLLARTPFDTYVVPGIFLAVVIGGSALVGALALLKRTRHSRSVSAAAGLIMVGWIAGETIIVGGFSWLQGLYLLTGLLVALGSRYLPVASPHASGRTSTTAEPVLSPDSAPRHGNPPVE